MTTLAIEGLTVEVGGSEVLRGVDLQVRSGEIHAVMGPNGAGKSTLGHAVMGRPGFDVTSGRLTLDGEDLLPLTTWERAARGLFLALQDPIELPGVRLEDLLAESLGGQMGAVKGSLRQRIVLEAASIGLPSAILDRAVNVDASGGERKRLETLQLAVLDPKIAILDELDSGLDIDAMRLVAKRVDEAAKFAHDAGRDPLGVLVITHYNRLLTELHPDRVHVLVNGRIVESGGPELAEQLEVSGYEHFDASEEGGK
jgi:Fe-S cluster assembly ATP-binding protein